MTNYQTPTFTEAKTKTGIFCRKTFTETSGETLVLIMGYGGNLRLWPPSFVDRLARRFAVVTYDNRGTGLSLIPERTEDYTIEAMADDLDDVMHLLDSKSHHILGYSMGSCIALQYAHNHPAAVRSLFLMCGTAGGALYAKPDKEISNALANPQGSTLWDIYVSTWKLMFSPKVFEQCQPTFKTVYENSRALPTKLLALAGHSHAFKGFDGTSYLPELKMTTTILAGKDDRLMPAQNAENLAKHISHAELVMLDNCEHGPHIQNEDAVIRAIEKTCTVAGQA